MQDIPLAEYADENGQQVCADLMGCTVGAISHMIKHGREVYIQVSRGKAVDYYERVKPGSQRRRN